MIRSRLLDASKSGQVVSARGFRVFASTYLVYAWCLPKIAVLQHLRVGHGPESAEDSGGYLTI
jgi:hypothetical protein